MNNKMFIIDGNAILFRSFYAIKTMTNYKNENISGIYGFAKQISSILTKFNPKYCIVAFDTGGKTWRHQYCAQYKSHRIETPKELIHQFAWMRLLCKACGINYYEGEECEADDWIASCVESYKSLAKITIVSKDKDLYQLIEDDVCVMHPFSDEIIKKEEAYNKFHVYPSQVVDYLALIGDSCDFIDGIKGIGPKTASAWIAEYGTIENIIQNADKLKPIARRDIFRQSYNILEKAKYLITLRSDLKVKPIQEAQIQIPCIINLKETLNKMGLFNLFDKFEKYINKNEGSLFI